ncbi:sensor histidine kinase [Teredinibacter purpureus]|uniref:sensor histidine kinase n=1 Tax=Teredinibacter purpureus TaxID=2731756 RepID=UPI0005F76B7C|nr:histidine kinase [Teredinibacter purpureus]
MHPLFGSAKIFKAVLIFWLFISILAALLVTESMQPYLHETALIESFSLIISWYFILIFFCFTNYHLCQRLPIGTTNTVRLIITQLVVLAATIGLWLLIGYGLAVKLPLFGLNVSLELYQHMFETNYLLGAILYAIWILIHYVYLIANDNEIENSDILRQKLLLNTIELKTVRATVHPHFLYNSLNMLANLSLVQPEKIHDFCVNIADFLRYSVNYSKKKYVTLNEEVMHIENYLRIEHERFGDRLCYRLNIEENCREITTIPLILFPLIENSIKHGIDASTEPGEIIVDIQRINTRMQLTVRNTYDDESTKANSLKNNSTGIGLASLRKRIRNTYGDLGGVNVMSDSDYFTVKVLLPLPEGSTTGNEYCDH